MKDINDNLSEVAFDILGMPAAVAAKGKGNEGDQLSGVPLEIPDAELLAFLPANTTKTLPVPGWAKPAPGTYIISATSSILPALPAFCGKNTWLICPPPKKARCKWPSNTAMAAGP
ncbi:MAG: hypothetical protein IPJ40_19635 [Saprospirales bacterium]|nr:hypothetical protein [Saprospirales bacterium]